MRPFEWRDVFTMKKVITPHIATLAFWVAEVFNVYIWIRYLRAVYKSYDYSSGLSPGFDYSQPYSPHTKVNYEAIFVGIVLFLLTTLAIRIVFELVLVIMRWQASTRGILIALTGGPHAAALDLSPNLEPQRPLPQPRVIPASPPWTAPAGGPSPPPAATSQPPWDQSPPPGQQATPTPPATPPQGQQTPPPGQQAPPTPPAT
jgi:hypothetical protein